MSTNYSGKSKRPYGGVSQQERIANRRGKLLESAVRTIGRVGYKFTTVKQICQEAGLTERYFYESFDNLEQLFIDAYIGVVQEFKSALIEQIMVSTNNSTSALRPCIKAYLTFLHEYPARARIMLFEIYGVSDKMNAEYRKMISTFVDLFTSVNEGYITQEQEERHDISTYMTAVLGAAMQIGCHWVLNDYDKPQDSLEDVLHEICATLVKKLNDS